MPTELSFVATNPDGSTVSLKPIEYRADWPHMGHQRLSFQCFDGQGIDERAKINVTKAGETMPVFCGWFDGIKRPSFKSKKPQEYHCLGHSAILHHRFPHVRAYTSNDAISSIFGDTVASQGILFQASSLMPPNWQDASSMGAPTGTYSAPNYTGTGFPQRIPVPTPAVYLGTTLLTQAASLAGMAVNQWFRDTDYLYVRTGVADPEGNPKNYPCYVLNYKNAHLCKGSPMPTWNLSSPGVPAVHERLITTLNRVMSHEGLEWNFVNRSDGDQELRCDLQLYNGWYDNPVKAYIEADLIDFEVGTLDAANYGFDSVVMKGRDSTFGYSFWPPARWGRDYHTGNYSPSAGVWKEHVTSDISMSYDQVFRCTSAMIGQTCDERYLKIWTRPDYTLQCGDFVRVTISSSPYNGQYDMRILNKAFESALNSDVMELTLYDGFASDI